MILIALATGIVCASTLPWMASASELYSSSNTRTDRLPLSQVFSARRLQGTNGLLRDGQDCWGGCGSQQGKCSFCGTGVCCRYGRSDTCVRGVCSNGCSGQHGIKGIDRHVCVAADTNGHSSTGTADTDCGGEEYVSTQGDGCFDVTLFYPAFLIVVIVVLCGLYKVYQRYSNKQQDGQAAVIQVAPWAPTPVAAQPTAMTVVLDSWNSAPAVDGASAATASSPPPAAAVAVAVATVGPESFATQLRGLAEMKAQGLLTDEEFAAAKMKLLSP